MLVLSRKIGEIIYIGEIEVRVMKITATKVSLAINAPLDCVVLRKEVRDRQAAQAERGAE